MKIPVRPYTQYTDADRLKFESDAIHINLPISFQKLYIGILEQINLLSTERSRGMLYETKIHEFPNSYTIFELGFFCSIETGEIRLAKMSPKKTRVSLVGPNQTAIVNIFKWAVQDMEKCKLIPNAELIFDYLPKSKQPDGSVEKMNIGVELRVKFVHELLMAGESKAVALKIARCDFYSYMNKCEKVTGELPIKGHNKNKRDQKVIDQLIEKYKNI